MNKDSIVDFLGFIIVKSVGASLCCIPLGNALWIGRRMGDLVYIMNTKRRSVGYANLKAAFPEKDALEIRSILRSHFENLGMSVVEILRLSVADKKYLDRHIVVKNAGRVKEALDKNKGVMFLTAHFGNWELSALAVASRGYTISLFAREQKYPRLNNLLNKYREMTGCKVIAKGFSIRDIIKTLHNNGLVAVLADQDAGARGVFVDFFNRPVSTAPGPVAFSLRTGAIILPSFTRRVDFDKHEIVIGEPLGIVDTGDREKDMVSNLGKIADILEGYIKSFPDQWLWSHKRWKSTPQRTVLILNDGKPGHLNQAWAVAEMFKEALGARLKARGMKEKAIIKIITVNVKFKTRFARTLLELASVFAGKRCQGHLGFLEFCLKKDTVDAFKNSYADIIISCGASSVATNIFLKYENNARNIVMMKPGPGRRKKFDLVILPRHDAPKKLKSNILVTETAPNRIKAISDKQAMGNNIGLFIGGDAKNFKLKKGSVEQVTGDVLKIAEEMDRGIFVTTSRRTSAEIDSFLKNRLNSCQRCKLLVIANEKNPEGTISKILGASEVVIVSPESISMISEAISSGKQVVVFKDKTLKTRGRGKYGRAIKGLESQGYIKIVDADKIYDAVIDILMKKPAIKKLDDRKKIIERLEGLV